MLSLSPYLDLDLCDRLERVRLLDRDRDLDLLECDLDLLRRLFRSLERLRDLDRLDLPLDWRKRQRKCEMDTKNV